MRTMHCFPRRGAARGLLALACVLAAAGCGGRRPPGQPAPATSVAPMDLGGQRVLLLPVQASAGLGINREEITRVLVEAITTRDTRTQWITPERLRRSLSQSPTFAPDPAALPNDPYISHGERRVTGPLMDVIRRYMALTEARLVFIPRSAVYLPGDSVSPGKVRLSAAVVDARTGSLVWWGEADGQPGAPDAPESIATAARAMAVRLVVPDSR
ncbi:MAG TPA: hypothetical protein VFQ45_20595 [Longimicrobium sp.]|nr:hypothetical protein [Longimicrobium sp.]